jgi:hypothetical protein
VKKKLKALDDVSKTLREVDPGRVWFVSRLLVVQQDQPLAADLSS